MTQLYHGTCWQEDLAASIGSTPLIRLRGASEATGCTILGKAEFMNPGGSVKDRAGLYIISDGQATVYRTDENGREVEVATLHKGQYVGEIGLLVPDAPHTKTVRATTNVSVLAAVT